MNMPTALRLGRVSNLPTVWSNALAGLVLAGATPTTPAVPPLLLGLSLLYVAGMYCNDWCDRAIDARERPGRPIPSGAADPRTVLGLGAAMLAGALALVAWAGQLAGTGSRGVLVGALLAGAILLYDFRHKGNPLAPLLMGLCRALVYLTAGYTAVAEPGPLLLPAALLAAYVAGLTYAARRESRNRVDALWPLALLAAPPVWALARLLEAPQLAGAVLLAGLLVWIGYAIALLRRPAVPQAVAVLIAGIALLDALFIALHGPWHWSLAALACLGLTRLWQRHVPGT